MIENVVVFVVQRMAETDSPPPPPKLQKEHIDKVLRLASEKLSLGERLLNYADLHQVPVKLVAAAKGPAFEKKLSKHFETASPRLWSVQSNELVFVVAVAETAVNEYDLLLGEETPSLPTPVAMLPDSKKHNSSSRPANYDLRLRISLVIFCPLVLVFSIVFLAALVARPFNSGEMWFGFFNGLFLFGLITTLSVSALHDGEFHKAVFGFFFSWVRGVFSVALLGGMGVDTSEAVAEVGANRGQSSGSRKRGRRKKDVPVKYSAVLCLGWVLTLSLLCALLSATRSEEQAARDAEMAKKNAAQEVQRASDAEEAERKAQKRAFFVDIYRHFERAPVSVSFSKRTEDRQYEAPIESSAFGDQEGDIVQFGIGAHQFNLLTGEDIAQLTKLASRRRVLLRLDEIPDDLAPLRRFPALYGIRIDRSHPRDRKERLEHLFPTDKLDTILSASPLRHFGAKGFSFSQGATALIAKQDALETLTLDTCKLDSASLAPIGGMHNLLRLNLSQNDIDDDGIRHLVHLQELKTLVLQGNYRGITDTGLEHIGKLQQLERLTLGLKYEISDEGLKHLLSLKELHQFSLVCDEVGDQGLEYVTRLEKLQELRVNSKKITDGGIAPLAHLSELRVLDIAGRYGPMTGASVDTFLLLPQLGWLTFRADAMSDEDILRLAELSQLHHMTIKGGSQSLTPANVEKLEELLPDCHIWWDKHR